MHFSDNRTNGEASFVYLDILGNIYILLDVDNDVEEKISQLFNEVSFFYKFWKNITNQAVNTLKTSIVTRGNFKLFQVCFLL